MHPHASIITRGSIAFMLLLCSTSLAARAQDIRRERGEYVATIEKTFRVEAGGTLALDRVNGSVEITGGTSAEVEIVEELRMDVDSQEEAAHVVERSSDAYEQQGNTIRVRGRRDHEQDVQRRYRIRVPSRFNADVRTTGGSITVAGLTGTVGLNTSGGSIDVSRVTGAVGVATSGGSLAFREVEGPVEATTSGGSVEVDGVKGTLDVRTSGGSVTIRRVDRDVTARTSGGEMDIENVGGRLQAHTSGGDVRVAGIRGGAEVETSGGNLDLRDVGGDVEAGTSGGDVEGSGFGGAVRVSTSAGDVVLRDVRGAVEAHTSVGDVTVEVTLRDFSRPHDVLIETSHGEIDLTLPPDFPGRVVAEVEAHSRFDRNTIQSDFPLRRETDEDDGLTRSSGDLNGGGARVELRASGGSIRIRKAGGR